MSTDFKIFIAIHDLTTVSHMITQLIGSQAKVHFRDSDEDQYTLTPEKTVEERRFQCRWVNGSPASFIKGKKFSWSFCLGDEKYIFESKAEVTSNGKIVLQIDSAFRTQKKNIFRYAVPAADISSNSTGILVKDISQPHIPCKLVDIHTEGFGFLVQAEATPYHHGQSVKALIQYGEQSKDFHLEGVVKKVQQNSNKSFVVGFKIQNFNSQIEGEIIDFVHYLKRSVSYKKTA